jgi:hypothetical protein
MDHTTAATSVGTFSGIFIGDCYKCWVKGVRSLYSGRDHVWIYQSSHIVVRDSYFYQSVTHSSVSYGVEIGPYSSDNLVENNIFDSDTDSNPSSTAGGAGNVAGYNFTVQTLFTNSPGWFQASDYEHSSGAGLWLREGNQAVGFTADGIHGTHALTTMFRNYYRGWQSSCAGSPCTAQTVAVHLYAASRYFNVIGNVLGTSGVHNNYKSLAPSGTNGNTSIFTLGWTGNGGTTNSAVSGFCNDSSCASHVPYDTLTYNTLMRWGNYDVVNNAVRWQSSEVPSTLNLYANPVPASQTLPASFYLAGKPSWWPSTVPYPANGPDVTGGNISGVGGHANNIPAAVCYGNTSSTNGILNFNADACNLSSK